MSCRWCLPPKRGPPGPLPGPASAPLRPRSRPAGPLRPGGGALGKGQLSGDGPASSLSRRGGGGAACHPPADLLGARPCPGALGECHLIPLAQEGGREPQNHSASEDDSTRGWPTSQGHLQPPCPLSPVLTAPASSPFLHTAGASCPRAFALASSWAWKALSNCTPSKELLSSPGAIPAFHFLLKHTIYVLRTCLHS